MVRAFLFAPVLMQAWACFKQKSPAVSWQGFFFVDKRFEISNLLNDIYEIIELSEILSDV
jgi:hypothetical protein